MRYEVRLCRGASFNLASGLAVLGAGRLAFGRSRLAHPATEPGREVAGTYYWREGRTWHTFDHVLVSGGLLGEKPPYLDERAIRVACTLVEYPEAFLGRDGLPHKFEWNDGSPVGLSDHLPVVGRIVL